MACHLYHCIKSMFILVRTDIYRVYHRLCSVLPPFLQEKVRDSRVLLLVGFIVFISVMLLVFMLSAVVFEVLLVVNVEEKITTRITALLFLLFFLSATGTATQSLERAAHPEDFDILYRSPSLPGILVIARFLGFAALQTSLFWILILCPIVAAFIWIAQAPFGVVLIWILLSFPFIGLTLSVRCVWGTLGYKVRSLSFVAFGASTLRVLISLFFVCLGITLVTYVILRLNREMGAFLTVLLEALGSGLAASLLQNIWIPSNWFVFALQSAVKGLSGRAFVYVGLVYVTIVPIFLGACWLTIYLAPMKSPRGVGMDLLDSQSRVSGIINVIVRKLPKEINFLITKEFKGLFRADPIIRQRLLSMLFLQMAIIGVALGLGLAQVYNATTWQILFPLLLVAQTLCYFLGDAFLPVTSVDAEGSAIAIYQQSATPLPRLFIAKTIVQVTVFLLLNLSLFIAMYGAFQFSVGVFITGVIVVVATSIVVGTAQIGGSALFPRFDWEHHLEIGKTPRASLTSEVCSWVFLVIMLQIMAVLAVFYTRQQISEPVMLIVIGVSTSVLAGIVVTVLLSLVRRRERQNYIFHEKTL